MVLTMPPSGLKRSWSLRREDQEPTIVTVATTGPAPEYSIAFTPAASPWPVHVEPPTTGPASSPQVILPTFTLMPLLAAPGAPCTGANLTVTLSVVTPSGILI